VSARGIPTNAIRHGGTLVAANLAAGNVVNAEDPSDVLIGDLFVPLGLASDGHTLYAGDWAAGNVWAVTETDTSLLASGLALPEGLAVDGDRLLVAETGLQQGRRSIWRQDRSAVVVGLDYTARVPEGFFPYGNMAGVAVGSNGAMYVSDDGVNKVCKFLERGRHHRHR
jgi:sugar lactone lactonase YvrE